LYRAIIDKASSMSSVCSVLPAVYCLPSDFLSLLLPYYLVWSTHLRQNHAIINVNALEQRHHMLPSFCSLALSTRCPARVVRATALTFLTHVFSIHPLKLITKQQRHKAIAQVSADGLMVDVTFTGYGNKETVPHTDVIAWEADLDPGVE
jgi:hypothetical protein